MWERHADRRGQLLRKQTSGDCYRHRKVGVDLHNKNIYILIIQKANEAATGSSWLSAKW
jgi:hypothetical protein